MQVKICGITDAENLRAAMNAGADYIGFVFYPPSPRAITPHDARELTREMVGDVQKVGLFVNPSDKELRDVLSHIALDMIQLHGDESVVRVIEIKAAYKIPVMKAVRIGGAEDLENVSRYEAVADWILFDSKIPPSLDPSPQWGEGMGGGKAYGGTGQSFDWTLLQNKKFSKPIMLSGGLTPENVAHSIEVVKPAAVDVSSGVERTRGVKDPAKITAFIEAVKKY